MGGNFPTQAVQSKLINPRTLANEPGTYPASILLLPVGWK